MNTSSQAKETLLTASGVKERGWTDALIRDFLSEPDETRPNPRYRVAGAPVRLYRLSRVEEAEAVEEFKARLEKARVRSAAGKKAAGKKREELKALIAGVVINVERRPLDQVRAEAITHYNERNSALSWRYPYREYGYATPNSDHDFLERITVNYVRHELTAYDGLWQSLYGQVGRDEAYILLRDRVLAAIAETYPDLADECRSQQLGSAL